MTKKTSSNRAISSNSRCQLASPIAKALKILASRLFAWRWGLGIGLFAILVVFKIHGVSLESWNIFVKDTTPSYRYPSIGVNRPIRSDEYAVSVPLVMAQCAHPSFFPTFNDRCGGTGMDMFVSTPPSPVWDWTVVGQAANWGYFLLGFERGLAWNWWFRYLLGFLFAFEFFLIWLRGDRPLAFVGALAVTLGAPTQWWTTTIPYLNLFFFASLVFLHKLFSWRQKAAQAVAAIGLAVSLCSFFFSFYPPFQFLYAVAWVFLGSELIWLAYRCYEPRPRRNAWVMLVGVALVLMAEGGYFFAVHRETLTRLASSTYPGKRCLLGGNFQQFLDIQTWKFVSLFTSFREVRFLNACGVSMFFVPMVAGFWGAIRARKRFVRESPFGLALAGWAGVMLLWMAFTWPEALARLSFFSNIHVIRAAVVASFILLLLVFKVAHLVWKEKRPCGFVATGTCLALSLGGFMLSFSINRDSLDYFTDQPPFVGLALLMLGITLLTVLTIGLLQCKRKVFLGGYAVVALLSGAAVHPLSMGAAPLMHKQLGEMIQDVVREHGEGRWLCHSSTVAQFVLAQGLPCVNGVQQTANAGLWRRVDPDEVYKDIWNRYAHVSIKISSPEDVSVVLRPDSADCIAWSLNEAAVRALGVRYLLWSGKKIHEPWVEYLGRSRLHFIYKMRENE